MSNQKIVISCDTTIALTKKQIEEYGLHVIPLNAIADGVEYHDTVDIDAEKLCELMRNGAKVSTSTPTIVEIEQYFDNLFEQTKADVIIHFTISSKLSSMYSLFSVVCQERYQEKVIVVDSLSICCWIKNQVLLAKKLADEGKDANEIVNIVKGTLQCTEDCAFVPESIEYLKRGGRISAAAAAVVNLIGVVPVLTFNNGEVGKKGVTRTFQKAMITAIKDWYKLYPNFDEIYDFVILRSDSKCDERAQKMAAIIEEFAPNAKYSIDCLSLNVTAHTGPGTAGIGIIKKVNL